MNKGCRASLWGLACLWLTACFQGTGEEDALRDPVAQTGISLGVQVNLASGATQADAAASIYKDAVRQPLVGGDFFLAESSQDEAMLLSLENLAGDYHAQVAVASASDPVVISTVYDPVRARQDRWYPLDELLVDPGPNEDLVGYSASLHFPAALENLAVNATRFDARSDAVQLTWDADSGDQITANALVTCRNAEGKTYTYPRFVVLGDDDGSTVNNSTSITVGTFVPNVNIVNAVATLQHELNTLITAALLQYYTAGLVNVGSIPLSTFVVQSCTVDLTVFRENGYSLPDNIAGGYVIGSTSDTLRFTFQPE